MFVNKHNLSIASFARKIENSSINNLCIEKDYTVATDGYRLVKVSKPQIDKDEFPDIFDKHEIKQDSDRILISADVAHSIEKRLPKKAVINIIKNAAISEDKDHVNFLIYDLESSQIVKARKETDSYPDYNLVFPKEEPVASFYINAKLLRELLRWFETFTSTDPHHKIKVEIYGEREPIKITARNWDTEQEATALIMPIQDI